jgi:heme exporter protein A
MLEASNLECVRGEKSLFRGLSFRLEPGACLMVQGANGSGKTSLLRMLCGLSPPADGEIRWNGQADPPAGRGLPRRAALLRPCRRSEGRPDGAGERAHRRHAGRRAGR